ncbi:MAG: cytochrome c biogenesis protein CcsA [Chloroflexi bacterium]|nr:cytochrome c biogenesis protein CcsA [Chloroflexota bacterium]
MAVKTMLRHTEMSPRLLWALWLLTGLSAVGFAVGLYMMLAVAGTDAFQGEVQRLFYFHLASFTGAFLAFGVAMVSGVVYLVTRAARWDRLSLSAVEVGFALALINVLLGSIWARPTWNTWWTAQDPRMVASAVMMLTCAAYLMLRQSIESVERRRTVAALLAIVLLGVALATALITRFRGDTIHPVVIGASPQNRGAGIEMASNMTATLVVNLIVWTLLLTPTLIAWRARLEELRERSRKA